MRVAVVTLFPELFEAFLQTSLVGRAVASGTLNVHLEPLRRHGLGKHLSVDDTPYGGGSGMVMRPDCVVAGIEAAEQALGVTRAERRILLTPQGVPFAQPIARRLSQVESMVLVCGRYEGFDERVRSFVDEEISLGDFVLTGGELPAMCVIEASVRLLPGVLGNDASLGEESFSETYGGLLEYPHYTRPPVFRGHEVPAVLTSGDHARIAAFRREQALARTRARRPDLLGEPAPHGGDEER
ncbi:MAG TPA: tRNA (guanosine(37)-N1)-methyltransferase TrmD [Polyangiaceae bacterium]|nr:tRNA (guanosine(37)-N1)-methyltransferase TrmD [Polyangiaceae bacterium]